MNLSVMLIAATSYRIHICQLSLWLSSDNRRYSTQWIKYKLLILISQNSALESHEHAAVHRNQQPVSGLSFNILSYNPRSVWLYRMCCKGAFWILLHFFKLDAGYYPLLLFEWGTHKKKKNWKLKKFWNLIIDIFGWTKPFTYCKVKILLLHF